MRIREYRLMLLAASLGVGLSGCSDARHARDQEACAGYGFRPGTKEHAQCMMTQDIERRRRVNAILADTPNTRCTKIGDTLNCNSY